MGKIASKQINCILRQTSKMRWNKFTFSAKDFNFVCVFFSILLPSVGVIILVSRKSTTHHLPTNHSESQSCFILLAEKRSDDKCTACSAVQPS